jgi:Lrp/AsnC family transcriptional regulator for asnA, asnC and gidA
MKASNPSINCALGNNALVQSRTAVVNATCTPEKKGKGQFVASVNIFVESSEKANVLAALSKLDNIEEVYDVAGEFDIVSKVSASSVEEFRDVLQKQIMKIKGVKSTITTIILQIHKKHKILRKPKPESANKNGEKSC